MICHNFEHALFNAFRDKLREAGPRPLGRGWHAPPPYVLGERIWRALANQTWVHTATGELYSCSFRYAGQLIADLCGFGDYLDWYCCTNYAAGNAPSDPGYIDDDILTGLAAYGWAPATEKVKP